METRKTRKNVNWRLSLELIRAIKRHAADRDEFPSRVAERAISEYLARQDGRKRLVATCPR